MWVRALVLVLAGLLVLHRSDGGEVIVAPAQVTSLRTPAGPLGGITPHGHCIVNLTDGRFVAVLESCREAQRRLEEAGR
jgi:hypothetical protein